MIDHLVSFRLPYVLEFRRRRCRIFETQAFVFNETVCIRDVDVTDADGFVEDECLGLEDPTAPAPEFQDIRETKGYQMVDHEMPPIECRMEALLVPSVESIGP